MIDLKILEESENKILKRRKLDLIVEHPGAPTPKKDDIIKSIAEKFKGDVEKIEVWMFSDKGFPRTRIKAYIWEEKIVKKKEKEKSANAEQQGEVNEA